MNHVEGASIREGQRFMGKGVMGGSPDVDDMHASLQ